MNLSRALRLSSPAKDVGAIVLVGAGGKTTAMFQLARELSNSPTVIVTATTHLGQWQLSLADHHIVAESPANLGELPNGIVLVTGVLDGERTRPINSSTLSWLREKAQKSNFPLLVEADGSRQRPLKASAGHEPPIPEFADLVIVVAGLGGLGQSLDESHVHRSLLFSALSGLPVTEPITPESLVRVLTSPQGGLKNIPPRARRVCLLNQADTPELQAIGGRMANDLLSDFDSVIVGSLLPSPFNLQTLERVAGIVIAAGASKRFGQPKQLLDWRGEPFVRAVARKALLAGLSPVIVVTGSDAENVEAALAGLNVHIVRNEAWQSGQGSSIAAGVRAVTAPSALPGTSPKSANVTSDEDKYLYGGFGGGREGAVGAATFLLADQPHIGADVIRALVETHAQSLPAILAPLVREERRANPVLFDRVTFPDLLALTGDIGGRAIFDRHKIAYLPWHDESLLLDVDTPEDYERIKRL